ncbi:MAG: MMPL family transporter, partial [Mycobacterium sp.]|nr:MMPL family transporter [Mycobacterium sp.]
MLLRIAYLATRFPRTLLICGFVLAVGCAAAGITVASHLESGGFVNDRAESQIANNIMATDFQGAAPNFVLVVDTEHGVTTPAVRERAQHIVDYLLSRQDIAGVQSYWTSNPRMGSRLRSADGRYGLIVAHIVGNESQIQTIAGAVTAHVAGTRDGATVRAGGVAASYHEMITQITKDLEIAEGFAIPITLVVLILVFGSLVAALLPLLLGLFAMAVTLAILRLFTLFSDVSIFAMNITTALGLAVAIDYSLFLVSRFREELAGGHPPAAAAIRAVQTAGRTVLFSALTVCLSMAVLSVFDMYFLRSIAVSAVAVVAAAAVSAIVLLPAALVLLGTRVNALDLRAFVRRTFTDRPPSVLLPPEQTRWYRTVHWVMRHAAPVGLLLVVVLVAVAGPFLGVKFGYPDDRIFRGPVASRQAGDVMRSQFPQVDPAAQTTIVLPNFHDPTALADYARALSQVDHVQAVESASGVFLAGHRVAAAPLAMANEHGTFLQITSDLDPFSPRGHAQLNALRAVPAPARTLFAGTAALNADSLRALSSRMPVAAVLIALTTLVVLFLFTGSVLLPLKTLVLTTLSLSAAFGAMVWIFQDGHWAGLFGIAPTG